MSHQGFYPGIFISKLNFRKKRKLQELDKDWNIFTKAALIPFSTTQAEAFVNILSPETKDKRKALLESGIDLPTFKNVHFSIQLSLTYLQGEEELRSVRFKPPANAKAAELKEVTTLQSSEHLLKVISTQLQVDSNILQKNSAVLNGVPKVREKLRLLNLDDDLSLTSVDSEYGQRLGWSGLRMHDDLNEKFSPQDEVQGKVKKFDKLSTLVGQVPPSIKNALTGTLLDVNNPCFCTPFAYTWTEKFNKSWNYTLQIDYPCGIKWCHKRVWGVRISYPCGLKWCTKRITFGFSVQLMIGFELRVECEGIIVYAAGSACIQANVAGRSLTSCIEAYLLGGGGTNVDITTGLQAGQCVYGLALQLGLRASIGSYTIWEGSFGYGRAIIAPCTNQLNADCIENSIIALPDSIVGTTIKALNE